MGDVDVRVTVRVMSAVVRTRSLEVTIPGTTTPTLGAVLDALRYVSPGVFSAVADSEGTLLRGVNGFVDGEEARVLGGLSAPLHDGSEVLFMLPVAGG